MIPGEVLPADGDIELNAGRETLELEVANSVFDRDGARGMRLDIPAGTAIRFEPGQSRLVRLVSLAGQKRVFGFNQGVMGDL